MIGVGRMRKSVLTRQNFPVPALVHISAVIDTGASISGFDPRVFVELEIPPVDVIPVWTPSTPPEKPHECELFDISLSLVAGGQLHPFPDLVVMNADCWLPNEGIEALLGRDILDRCHFSYDGPSRTFTLAF